MITVNSMKYIQDKDKWDFNFKGMLSDTKPTGTFNSHPIATNSLFLELDTETFYYYDGESWQVLGTSAE